MVLTPKVTLVAYSLGLGGFFLAIIKKCPLRPTEEYARNTDLERKMQ
jgi:hypothetical protein